MKKILFLLFVGLLSYSCEKDNFIPNDEIPDWLKDRIAQDEEIIEANPQSGLDIAAWKRYEYEKNYYFEYINLISSALVPVFKEDGIELNYDNPIFEKYNAEKCCKRYVWKGPNYIGD